MRELQDYAAALGRVLVSLIFVISGLDKLGAWAATAARMEAAGIPIASLLLPVAVLFELGGGLLVLSGLRARLGALMLIVFTVLATLLVHHFWTYSGEAARLQQIQFMKNLGLIGGLLLVFAHGAGAFSLDRWLARRRTVRPPPRL